MRILTPILVSLAMVCTLPAQVMQQALVGTGGSVVSAYTYCYPITIPDAQILSTQSNFPVLFRSPTGTVTTVTAAGSTTLTVSTGDTFPTWFDNTMSVMVNGTIYPISSITSTLIIVVTGTITNGTYAWNGTPYLSNGITGSKVLSASGYDIGFFSDSSCITKIPWETVLWTAATGVGEWHFSTTLTDGSANSVYLGYGAASVTTDQSNKTGTWSSDNVLVMHLPNGSSLTANDSTSNANNGTVNGTVTAAAGEIDGGAANTTNMSDIRVPDTASLRMTTMMTVEYWINQSSRNGGGAIVVQKRNPTVDSPGYNYGSSLDGSGKIVFQFYNAGYQTFTDTGTAVALNTWTHVATTFDSAGAGKIIFYRQGAAQNNPSNSTALDTASPQAMQITNYGQFSSGTFQINGVLDELRISNAVLSANRIAMDYASQGAPFTFWSTTAH